MRLTEEVREAITATLTDLFGAEGEYRSVIQRECNARHGYIKQAFQLVFAILVLIMGGVILAYLTGGRG